MTLPHTTMSAAPTRPRFLWERAAAARPGRDEVTGADLAALRLGIGRDAGSVPEMWPYYTTLNPDGNLTGRLRAEHVALTLYAVHQQSRPAPVHWPDVGVGTAMLALRDSDRFSPVAMDRRFSAAATANSLGSAAIYLRGLVSQLKVAEQGLDYTRLFYDLTDWQRPDKVDRVRRRWGSQYFARRTETDLSA